MSAEQLRRPPGPTWTAGPLGQPSASAVASALESEAPRRSPTEVQPRASHALSSALAEGGRPRRAAGRPQVLRGGGEAREARRREQVKADKEADSVERLSLHIRVQHMILFSSLHPAHRHGPADQVPRVGRRGLPHRRHGRAQRDAHPAPHRGHRAHVHRRCTTSSTAWFRRRAGRLSASSSPSYRTPRTPSTRSSTSSGSRRTGPSSGVSPTSRSSTTGPSTGAWWS